MPNFVNTLNSYSTVGNVSNIQYPNAQSCTMYLTPPPVYCVQVLDELGITMTKTEMRLNIRPLVDSLENTPVSNVIYSERDLVKVKEIF